MPTTDELIHKYASKYYDPVKRKEYYERTKKLKGKRSAADFGKQQRETWAVVKDGVGREKQAKRDSIVRRAQLDAQRTQDSIRSKLAGLSEKFSKLGPAMKKLHAGNFEFQRARLSTQLKSTLDDARNKLASKLESLDKEYENIADSEYSNIQKNLPGKDSEKKRGKTEKAATKKTTTGGGSTPSKSPNTKSTTKSSSFKDSNRTAGSSYMKYQKPATVRVNKKKATPKKIKKK